jgi:paraquat-inducible protein B
MSKKANPALVGSFVIGAIVLSIIGIMLLGGGNFFERKFECIMYFEESISGLDVGAPVDFRGVRIGTVTGVRLEFDSESDLAIVRPVTMQIEESRIQFASERNPENDPAKVLEILVNNHGLRARLVPQSLLTGRQKIELGYYPDQPIKRRIRDSAMWEMPTIASPFKQAAAELAHLPIHDIVNETHRAIKRMADIMDPEMTGQTFQNINQTMVRLETLLGRLDSKIDPFADKSARIMGTAQGTLMEMQETLKKINLNLDPQSDVRSDFFLLIEDLQKTSRSLRNLTDYLEEHPESLLRGKNK